MNATKTTAPKDALSRRLTTSGDMKHVHMSHDSVTRGASRGGTGQGLLPEVTSSPKIPKISHDSVTRGASRGGIGQGPLPEVTSPPKIPKISHKSVTRGGSKGGKGQGPLPEVTSSPKIPCFRAQIAPFYS